MKKIYKYTIGYSDLVLDQPKIKIQLPKSAEILSVQVQEANLVFWALVETSNNTEWVYLLTIGTGCDFWPIDYKYIGTAQALDGTVFHVFAISEMDYNEKT